MGPLQTLAAQAMINALLALLSPETLRKALVVLLDMARAAALDTQNTTDDAIVIPICDKLEEAFGLRDE